jgi:hypothetical protein
MPTQREVRIPADSMHALRRSLSTQLGPVAAGRCLQEAGYAAGDALVDRLGRELADAGATPATSFWGRLAAIFKELGWGAVAYDELHPGVGALVVSDWFEIDPSGQQANCPFTTGVLANVLGKVAGQEVAVLQASDAHGAPGRARFLFGSPDVLNGVYAGLAVGQDLDATLLALD